MDIQQRTRTHEDKYKAMVDQGANVNLGPVLLAKALGLTILPHTDGRQIGTADAKGQMEIMGWIFPKGFTGPIELVKRAACTLLSGTQIQRNWMGVHCPPLLSTCELTILEYGAENCF
jgi:hypothetical protein